MNFTKSILLFLISILIFSCAQQEETKIQEDNSSPKEETETGEVRLSSVDDVYRVKRINDPQISPDGEWIIFTLSTPDIPENKLQSDIYAIKNDGTGIRQITKDDAADFGAVWSPEGKEIAFLSTRNDAPQVFVKPFPDGAVKQITEVENGASNLLWSPMGTNISYTTDVKYFDTVEEKYPEMTEANVMIYDDLPIRHWDEWTDEFKQNVFYMPAKGGQATNINNEPYDTPLKPFGGKEEIDWSPDGKKIAYTSKKVDNYVFSTNSEVYVYNLETKETKNITEGNLGYDKNPLFSPNGDWIAYVSQERPGFESDRIRLMIYNLETKERIELTKTHDQWVNNFVWHPNGDRMYYTATDSGCVQIFEVAVPSGEWKQISEGWYDHSNLRISNDGEFLVFGRESMLRATELYKMSTSDYTVEQITNINGSLFDRIKEVKITERWVRANDGKMIHCWVLFPPDFDSTKQYPMISYLQGGPQSMISQRFHPRWNWQLMASHGYIMLLPNRRGLPGFGQDWNDAISLDWGGKPMDDILATTDELAKEPYVNENAMAAIGASAGGYAAFWLAGNHEGRFKAFISHCGVFNLESMYGSTEELFFPNWEYGGPYWEEKNKANYDKNSPHNYVKNWDTPILISTGMGDYRVPYTQSLEAFTAARAQDIPAEIIIFPEETHFIAKPQEFIIWQSEFFEFLDKYCK